MSELPKGWILTELCNLSPNPKQDIVDGPFGSNLKASEYVDEGIPIIRLQNIDRNIFIEKNIRFITSEKAEELSRHSFRGGDIVATKLGVPVGKACIVPDSLSKGIIVADVVRVRIDENNLFKRFIAYAINSPFSISQISTEVKGSTRPRVNLHHIRSLKIPLAPLNEQRRIVEKLEKLLGKVDACKKRLEKIPLILKRFRQSILAAACSGRLTADWRKREEGEKELPTGWRWVLLEDLLPKGRIFDGPFGSNLKTSDYTASGVRVIRLENIGHLIFFNEKETYISHEKYETLTKHSVGCGDVIFSSFIADEIRVCVLPELKTKAIAKADCFCLRPITNHIDRTFLTFQLASRESYNALVENVHGATRPRINTTQLRSLRIRVCPLQEQQEIVRRVESLLRLADQIEARYYKAKAYVDKLAQSILAKAFRGELVSQDPNDEPASVLLERIRSQRGRR